MVVLVVCANLEKYQDVDITNGFNMRMIRTKIMKTTLKLRTYLIKEKVNMAGVILR